MADERPATGSIGVPSSAGLPTPQIGTTSGASDLLSAANARTAELEATLARKQAKIDKLKIGLSDAQAKSSDRVPTLESTLALKQNKINTLKAKVATAETLASSSKVAAITAEGLSTKLAGSAATSQTGLSILLLVVAAVAGWWAWKKGWLKF